MGGVRGKVSHGRPHGKLNVKFFADPADPQNVAPFLRPSVGLLDDDPDVRRSIQRIITRFGHSVRTASSAEEADQWLTSERLDACLLDLELPRMKGLEFLSWALSRDPELAIIMLTGLDVPEVAIECIDHGARTYLVKPVEVDFLRLALRDALAVRKGSPDRPADPGGGGQPPNTRRGYLAPAGPTAPPPENGLRPTRPMRPSEDHAAGSRPRPGLRARTG